MIWWCCYFYIHIFVYLCIGYGQESSVTWMKELCIFIYLCFFSHSVWNHHRLKTFLYLFWHRDKSKAASASHNQIRAEREQQRQWENKIMQHHHVDRFFWLKMLWVVFGAAVTTTTIIAATTIPICMCVCGISCFCFTVNAFDCVSQLSIGFWRAD